MDFSPYAFQTRAPQALPAYGLIRPALQYLLGSLIHLCPDLNRQIHCIIKGTGHPFMQNLKPKDVLNHCVISKTKEALFLM